MGAGKDVRIGTLCYFIVYIALYDSPKCDTDKSVPIRTTFLRNYSLIALQFGKVLTCRASETMLHVLHCFILPFLRCLTKPFLRSLTVNPKKLSEN